ncbi:MAG: ATPase [Clostridia bacterium]|nr:ATPase [Clostridia bacterium]
MFRSVRGLRDFEKIALAPGEKTTVTFTPASRAGLRPLRKEEVRHDDFLVQEESMILGIEFGSTRVKAVLTDRAGNVLAVGGYEWENKLIDGFWTYSIDEVFTALRRAYSSVNNEYRAKYGEYITKLDAIGISAMMHGYLAFDGEDNLLVPFRTWRNTNTAQAAEELTKELGFNMPQRWSATHYYQAVLNGEPHADRVAFLTTLSGYVHWKLTGKKVLGVGDASGMFPVRGREYDIDRVKKYNELLRKRGITRDLRDLLPKILLAGEDAGTLTEEGAKLLDESRTLKAGALFCPPEGDAGTGMVATNSVREKTGNVSAGTSSFVMIVLDRPLKNLHTEIDVVTTPAGLPVAMVHANNCTSEINAWIRLFDEVITLFGGEVAKGELYDKLFKISARADADAGVFACNFLSGEPVANVGEGRPMVFRMPDGKMDLANFMQAQIYSAVAPLQIGMKILEEEGVSVNEICGHGGYFKTEYIGQSAMSAALSAPVTVLKNAGEGGAYGIALLALYRLGGGKEDLADFLDARFAKEEKTTVRATDEEVFKFNRFMKLYRAGLAAERAAAEV